jgi:hypothetical protein
MDDSGNAYISNFSNASFSAKVAPGDTISTPLGKIVMRKTKAFNRYKDKKIVVTRSTLNNAIEAYCSRLKCEIADKQSSVINITMNDEVPRRAEDVINGIIIINVDNVNATILDSNVRFFIIVLLSDNYLFFYCRLFAMSEFFLEKSENSLN